MTDDDTEIDPRPTAPASDDAGALAAGTVLGRFTIGGLLGAGGMGAVYQARDPQLDRSVAIKVLPGRQASENLRRRLVREAQALAQLQHPNVVAVHEVGVADDRVFIAMELVDGVTLGRHLKAHPQRWPGVLSLFTQAGRGLAAAHAKGLVHRDFKPGNVLVDRDGRVRVTDFGLARLATASDETSSADGSTEPGSAGSSTSTVDAGTGTAVDALVPVADSGELASPLTRTGAFLGTPRYMAPEQFARRPATALSDQFSFCVALWEALFGDHPFAAGNDLGGLAATVPGATVRPPARGKSAPRRLIQLVSRGLAVDPSQRHPSMAALVAALDAVPQRRRRVAIASAGALIAVAAALAAVAITRDPGVDCTRAGRGLDALWNPGARAGLTARFASTRPYGADTANRVASSLDQWAGRWRDARIDACRATHERGEQSADLLDRRSACLDRGRLALSALMTGFETVDGTTVDHAIDAVAAIPAPSECTPARVAAGAPRSSDPRVVAIDKLLQTAETSWNLGRGDESLRLLEQATASADAAGDVGLRTRARVALGAQLVKTSPSRAREILEQSMVSAAAGADADTEADIALALMDEAVYSDDPKRVVALLPTARAAVARSGRGKDMQRLADVELAAAAIAGTKMDPTMCDRVAGPGTATPTTGPACRCRIAAAAFDIDDALRECGQSVRARQAYYGATHPSVATELHNVAAAYGSRGDHELALATGRTALALSRAAFGFDSQQAAVDLLGLAIALDRIDRYSEARAHYEEAVAIMRRVSDVPNISLARALVYYGEMLSEMGEHAAAAMKARDGLRIAEEVVGPEHKRLVSLLNSHGNILTNAGRNAEAAVVLARSETLARTHFGAGHRMALVAGMMRAQALTRSGDAKAAVGPAQRVVDAMDASASVFNVGIAHGILGEALARSGDKVRGRTELLEARRILDGLGESGRSSVKEIDGLIRELVPAERR